MQDDYCAAEADDRSREALRFAKSLSRQQQCCAASGIGAAPEKNRRTVLCTGGGILCDRPGNGPMFDLEQSR